MYNIGKSQKKSQNDCICVYVCAGVMELADMTDSKSVGLILRAGSTPATGTNLSVKYAGVAQLAERPPCKRRVTGSNPVASAINIKRVRIRTAVLNGGYKK